MDSFSELMRQLRRQWRVVRTARGAPAELVARDLASLRRPELESDLSLTPATMQWLALLPEYARPLRFCERFPRVVNRVAAVWTDRRVCRLYFESLLGDDRGGRKGFGFEVRKEIVRLRVFHEKSMGDADSQQDWKQRLAALSSSPTARRGRPSAETSPSANRS